MKIVLKNYTKLYKILKKIYSYSLYSKKRQKRNLKIIEEKKKIRIAAETKIMEDVFNNEFIIHNGPFKGMKYINNSLGSALLPKILGSYEEPIQEWIDEAIYKKKYRYIIDIGCAEGYYAVGFALKMPNSFVIAYDINDEARRKLNELKIINNITNIQIKSECSHQELNSLCKVNTLVFCDIEGFEKVLLDPLKVNNLKYVDIIVETHDCFVPNITDELIKRFYLTHIIKIVVDYPFRKNSYTIPNEATKEYQIYMTDERRPKYMKFIYMKSIYEEL